ncbi:MAG: UDP-N-acetylglucosamine pyrophosphorylase [Clostridia bacterium]|nr:UDP-N-acetylglucosamine pyrophosphorylase [Clostridia bacterium]
MDRIKTADLFDLSHTLAAGMLSACEYPWEALAHIGKAIIDIGKNLDMDTYDCISENIWIAKSARISPAATILAPCIVCENAEVRPGAYIRGNALVGKNAVVGNSTELKNCILFDGTQVPHYNYVGDSILGCRAHMGAGAITSNVKGDRTNIEVHGEQTYPTGLRKFGAMLGDFAEIGCNTVLNPGAIIGRNTQIYPLSSVRGVIPADSIVKGARGTYQKV